MIVAEESPCQVSNRERSREMSEVVIHNKLRRKGIRMVGQNILTKEGKL